MGVVSVEVFIILLAWSENCGIGNHRQRHLEAEGIDPKTGECDMEVVSTIISEFRVGSVAVPL